MGIRGWVLCVLLVAVGCGSAKKSDNQGATGGDGGGAGGSNGTGDGGPTSSATTGGNNETEIGDNPLLAIVDALCKRERDCAKELNMAAQLENLEWCRWATIRGDAGEAFQNPDIFEEHYSKQCPAEFPSSPADVKAVKACIDGIAALSCSAGGGAGENALNRLGGPCLVAFASMTAFVPKALAVGALCAQGDFCSWNGYCKITNVDEHTGNCVEFTRTEGQACEVGEKDDRADKGCAFPLVCVPPNPWDACEGEDGSADCTCQDTTQQPVFRALPGKLGDSCDDETRKTSCSAGLVCDETTKKCKSAALGAACTTEYDCFCRDGVCVQPKVNDPCADDTDCVEPHVCVAGKCTEPAPCGKKGEACWWFTCDQALTCDDRPSDDVGRANTCVPRGSLGDPCSVPGYGDCGEGLVCGDATQSETCVARAKKGEACDDNVDCLEGLQCRGRECASVP